MCCVNPNYEYAAAELVFGMTFLITPPKYNIWSLLIFMRKRK